MNKIIKRNPADKEIDWLINDIRQFPNLTYVSKKRWENFKHCYVLEVNNNFVGVCVVYPLEEWVKIGPLVILKKYQRKGYGNHLFTNVIRRYRNKNIFVASSNKAVENITIREGFVKIENYFRLPSVIKLFLLKQIFEYLNVTLMTEMVRKRLFFNRKKFSFFLKTKNSPVQSEWNDITPRDF